MRPVVLVTLVSALIGCATWRPQGLAPSAVIERDHPMEVRVTRQDSSHTILAQPRIEHASIVGTTDSNETIIALADVAYVSLRRRNGTVKAVGAGLGVAAGLIVLLAATWD